MLVRVKKRKTTMKAKDKIKKRQLRLKGINGKIRPSAQDVRIAENIVTKGMKKGEALIAAGVPEGSAKSNSAEILARPGVRAAMAMALERADVNLDRVAQVLNEGLSATKIISANLLIVDADGKEELPCKDGFIDATDEARQKEFIRVEDFAVRHKYLETSCKLLDLFPSERTPGNPGDTLPSGEEQSMIAAAEAEASQRNISRYVVVTCERK